LPALLRPLHGGDKLARRIRAGDPLQRRGERLLGSAFAGFVGVNLPEPSKPIGLGVKGGHLRLGAHLSVRRDRGKLFLNFRRKRRKRRDNYLRALAYVRRRVRLIVNG
jgi:hypothetical protein